jgi:hypothetical protein
VHLGDEHLTQIRQATQKGRLLAIPPIDTYPTETDTVLAGLHNHLDGQIRLALEHDL